MATKIAFGPFVLDVDRGTLVREGRPIALSSKGLQLLQALLRAPGQVLSQGRSDAGRLVGCGSRGEQPFGSDCGAQEAAGAVARMEGTGSQRFRASDIGSSVALHAQRETDGGNAPRIDAEARPSIAVLPFTNLGGDRGQEYLADGITEDIITALTRFRWFFVIARNSSFAYKDKSLT